MANKQKNSQESESLRSSSKKGWRSMLTDSYNRHLDSVFSNFAKRNKLYESPEKYRNRRNAFIVLTGLTAMTVMAAPKVAENMVYVEEDGAKVIRDKSTTEKYHVAGTFNTFAERPITEARRIKKAETRRQTIEFFWALSFGIAATLSIAGAAKSDKTRKEVQRTHDIFFKKTPKAG